MSTTTVLYVEKDTDLMRSTFVALGLAHLFQLFLGAGSGRGVMIYDQGSAYRLDIPASREELLDFVAARGLPQVLPAVIKPPSAGELKELSAGVPLDEIRRRYQPAGFRGMTVDYGNEKAKAEESRKAKKTKSVQEGDILPRDPDFPLWAHLCSYFGKGSAMRVGYPLLINLWHSHIEVAATNLCDVILTCYSEFPNRVNEAHEFWASEISSRLDLSEIQRRFKQTGRSGTISALAIVSPSTSKGSFSANGAQALLEDTPETFWLEMYLAFAGFMAAGMPFNAGKDVLLYFPLPRRIHFLQLQDIVQRYRDSADVRHLYDNSGFLPRAKIDALSEIGFYRAMVEHYYDNPLDDRRAEAISGVVGYYYKDISTQIPLDETLFIFPAWVELGASDDRLLEAQELLKAHHDLIARIRGGYAEELLIINHYRRFAAGARPEDWIEFAIAYSQHRFNLMEDSPWLSHIDLSLLERTLMNNPYKDYTAVLKNPGFQNIAAAIRSCTVQLRYFKDVKKKQSAFKVRHGLGDDLRRRAQSPDHFIEDLTAFVHDYMRESSNVQANTGETRPFITESDLYDVIQLIPDYGSPVVAGLLVAAGYASDFDRSARNQ